MFMRDIGLCLALHITTTFREASFHLFQESVDINITFYADCRCTRNQLATSGSHSTIIWHSVSQKCIHISIVVAPAAAAAQQQQYMELKGKYVICYIQKI
jgi:hypothetical protein